MSDDDIHTGLRALVDEGGPAASEETLRDVVLRGRRQRRRRRLGAVAGVVAVIAGVGVAMATIPTFGTGAQPLGPAAGAQQQTSMPGLSRTPEQSRTATPTTTPRTTSRADNAGLSCPEAEVPTRTELPLPAGVRVCPGFPDAQGDEALAGFADAVRAALPEATVTEQAATRGSRLTVRVTGAAAAGTVSFNVWRYYGYPTQDSGPVRSGDSLIVPGGVTIMPNVRGPEVLIYFPMRLLLVVRTDAPAALSAGQLRKIVNELVQAGIR